MKKEKTNVKRFKKLKKDIKGITLIALVVTIIVLLILAGVAINLTIGENGIFSRAQDAANTWRNAEANEQSALNDLSSWMDQYLNENGSAGNSESENASREGLEVGQYVKYVPDTYVNSEDGTSNYTLTSDVSGYEENQQIAQSNDLTWRIMSVNEDGTVDLISNTTEEDGIVIFLNGATGYNNGVWILNDIAAKQYSNSSLGVKEARSINIEDIEKRMNNTGKTAIKTWMEENGPEGGKQTYTGDSSYYPNLYAEENGSGINTSEIRTNGIGLSDSYYSNPSTDSPAYRQATNGLTVTQTFYGMNEGEMVNYFDNNFYKLIFPKRYQTFYWLASRYAICLSEHAEFGLFFIEGEYFASENLFDSNRDDTFYEDYYGLRAVVSLKSNVKFVNGDGSKEHPYELEI